MISAWASKYVSQDVGRNESAEEYSDIIVSETELGKFQNTIVAGNHRLIGDEPKSVGGLDSGPSPYDYLATALGTCTSMTMRMYASFKKLDVGKISVAVSHKKIHAQDCMECTEHESEGGGKIDIFERKISVEGLNDEVLSAKLLEIADKCPVHKTLEKGAKVKTSYK